jgi:uncharacterized membrane protein (DUF4010 family)
MAAAAVAVAAYFYRLSTGRKPGPEEGLQVKNPFSLTAAVQFGLLFAVILVVVELTRIHLPAGSMYVVAAIAGLTDVDAITLTLAESARTGGDPVVAVRGITIAALANTVVKCALFAGLGGRSVRKPALAAGGMIVAAGALALAF